MSSKENKIKMPFTCSKAIDVLIIVLMIISVLGIIAFSYSFISDFIFGSVALKTFINIIYVMMYVSIVTYIVSFFIKHNMASIHAILGNYCMLTLMCTITLPNVINYPILLFLVLAVIILVPFMRNNLAYVKRCFVIMWIVLTLVAIMTALKLYYGLNSLSGENAFLTFVAFFNCFHPLIVWIIFMLLYAARVRVASILDKDYIKTAGLKAASENYSDQLNAFLQKEKDDKKQAKAEKKEKIKEKMHKDKKDD